MAGFRPFEYLAWAKAVPPGAGFPMHLSGLLPPPSLPVALPDWAAVTAPAALPRAALVEALTAWLGAAGRDALVVSGASEAVFVALAGHLARGQPVIVEEPAYRAIERAVQFLGGVPVALQRREQDGWRFDAERLDALLEESGARLVAITDPHNPTGISIDGETRRAVIEVVERHGALLLVDEIFAPFRGPQRAPAWAATSERVLSVGSLTKGWGLSALRTGWVLGAAACIQPCRQVFDLLGVNPPSATLALAREALRHAVELDSRAQHASRRVHEIYAGTEWGEAATASTGDGFIGFLRLPGGWSSETAASALRELDGVQVVPGHFFGRDDHIRIGFDPEATDGAEGCRLIAARLNAPRHLHGEPGAR